MLSTPGRRRETSAAVRPPSLAVGLEPLDAARADRAGAVVVDIRSDTERRRRGEIPGALHIERAAIELASNDTVVDRLNALARPGLPVILISSSGRASSTVAETLRGRGVPTATDVRGGFAAWARAGLRVIPSDT